MPNQPLKALDLSRRSVEPEHVNMKHRLQKCHPVGFVVERLGTNSNCTGEEHGKNIGKEVIYVGSV